MKKLNEDQKLRSLELWPGGFWLGFGEESSIEAESLTGGGAIILFLFNLICPAGWKFTELQSCRSPKI
jgi:hypothetical protein